MSSGLTANSLVPENAFGLILGDAFALSFPLLEMFIKISFCCLDVSGLRLCWLTAEEFNTVTLTTTFDNGNVRTVRLVRI